MDFLKRKEEKIDYSKPELLTILGPIPFLSAKTYISNLYQDKTNVPVVDFAGVQAGYGFGYVADTTGHRYESEQQQAKKKQLAALWESFDQTVMGTSEGGLLYMLKQAEAKNEPIPWLDFRTMILRAMHRMSDKMMEIGKTSTFTGVFLVWMKGKKAREVC